MRTIATLLFLGAAMLAGAEDFVFKATVTADSLAAYTWALQPAESADGDDSEPLTLTATTLTGKVKASPSGFYRLYAMTSDFQLSLPLYLPGASGAATVSVCGVKKSAGKDSCPPYITATGSPSALALSAMQEAVNRIGRDIWEPDTLSAADVERLLAAYAHTADSLRALPGVPGAVSDFLGLWAVAARSTGWENIRHRLTRLRVTSYESRVKKSAGRDTCPPCIDTPLAACFAETPRLIAAALPPGTLSERLAVLWSTCHTPLLRQRVAESLVTAFILVHDYAAHYEEGLAEIKTLTARYALPPRYAEEYAVRRYSVPGAEFPDVALTDSAGHQVSFKSLRGRVVYVDLWASWCVPCCRLVPAMQALEKELASPDVAFLSISIDTNAEAWHKKRAQLAMHGLQWRDSTGRLADALNVKGIPHFLIYGRDGRLLVYDAPSPKEVERVREELKN